MSERRSRGGLAVFGSLRRTILFATLIVMIFITVLTIKTLNAKKVELANKTLEISKLQEEIKEEEEKSQILNKSNGNVTTDEEIENLARQELGLIKRDEIVIKPR